MSVHPGGPAALIEKATGETPLWAEREHVTHHDDGTSVFTYRLARLAPKVMQQFAAITDPRVGWAVDVRSLGDQLRIRARRKEHSDE